MKTLSCREAGFDCDYIVKGETEEEIFRNGGHHAMKEHGMKEEDLTPEFKEKLRGLIKIHSNSFLIFCHRTTSEDHQLSG